MLGLAGPVKLRGLAPVTAAFGRSPVTAGAFGPVA
jgi:hypothetical protein